LIKNIKNTKPHVCTVYLTHGPAHVLLLPEAF